MSKEEILRSERRFIHLLLNDMQLVKRWLDSDLDIEDFETGHKAVLEQIKNSYEEGFLLTRDTFMTYVSSANPSPKHKIAHEVTFDTCFAAIAKNGDYPALEKQIISNREIRKRENALNPLKDSIRNTKDNGALADLLRTGADKLCPDKKCSENKLTLFLACSPKTGPVLVRV